MRPGLDDNDSLTRRPSRTEALLAAIPNAPIEIRGVVRNSQHFRPWLDRGRREQARIEARAAFETDLECGLATLDIVTCPLPQYQRQGAMHLAFGERTLLADDMGLGKTIQAIAAAELLARIKGLHRTLIICPASLKAVWEEQIAVQRPRQ